MRRKMEKRTKTRGPELLDIKLGPGAMADIEFLAQMLQMKYGAGQRELPGKSVPQLLRMTSLPVLSEQERASLLITYLFYREIEKLMRITLEERGSTLPAGPALETLALALKQSPGHTLQTRVAASMKETRALFLDLAGRIGEGKD